MQASRLISSTLNAVKRRLHVVADGMRPEDWLGRGAPGTNLPAFTLWHVARVVDSTISMGSRGVPEAIDTELWASNVGLAPRRGSATRWRNRTYWRPRLRLPRFWTTRMPSGHR